jgi:hypothetical protein
MTSPLTGEVLCPVQPDAALWFASNEYPRWYERNHDHPYRLGLSNFVAYPEWESGYCGK